jgi:hypothetical protein
MKITLRIFFIVAFVIQLQMAFSQLKVTNNGYVGIGTNNPISNLHVNGRIFLTGNGNTFRILPNNPGTEIGTSTDRIDFWYTTTGHNKLYAQEFYTQCDSMTKYNICLLKNGLETVKQFKSYSFFLKNDTTQPKRKEYGFLAQDVEKIIPEMVDTSMGIKLINYNEFIPFIIEAIKEQQMQIDSLQLVIFEQEKNFSEITKEFVGLFSQFYENGRFKRVKNIKSDTCINNIDGRAMLFDNAPNPFDKDTKIKFYIPDNSQSSRLILHDLQGVEISVFTIHDTGLSYITINGSELKPGMYLYSLIVDNRIIDTKRMLLTK